MSWWTYVRGIVEVDTFADSDPEAMFMAQTVVNHLPRITGSERDVSVYCVRPNGANMSSNCDEFDIPSNLYTPGSYFRSFETQTKILIVLSGNLRDRKLPETLRETSKFLSRLASRLPIDHCLISVSDMHHKSYIFNDPEYLHQADVSDWAFNLLGKNIINKMERERNDQK